MDALKNMLKIPYDMSSMMEQLSEELALILYCYIERTDDEAELRVLNEVVNILYPIIDEQLNADVCVEFSRWIGLKLDAPEMGADYGRGLLEDLGISVKGQQPS